MKSVPPSRRPWSKRKFMLVCTIVEGSLSLSVHLHPWTLTLPSRHSYPSTPQTFTCESCWANTLHTPCFPSHVHSRLSQSMSLFACTPRDTCFSPDRTMQHCWLCMFPLVCFKSFTLSLLLQSIRHFTWILISL